MTAKRTQGAQTAPDFTSPLSAALSPNGNPFLLSQRMALEATRFWARRLHAYADQFEVLAGCKSPNDLAQAQARFLEQMREDYAAETQAMSAVLRPEPPGRAAAE